MFREIEASELENITLMTSNLSLDPEETQVLRELYEQEFHPKQSQTGTHDSIISLENLCDKVVADQMTCPTCGMLVKSRSKYTIIIGCRAYPFLFTRKTWPLSEGKGTDAYASTL